MAITTNKIVIFILALSALIMATNSYAKTKVRITYEQAASMAYKKKDFKKTIQYLKLHAKRNNFRKPLTARYYLLLGLSYWELKNYDLARANFEQAISKRYARIDEKIRRQYKNGGIEVDEADVPKGLLILYYKMGSSLLAKSKKSESKEILERAQTYFAICEEFGYQEDATTSQLSYIEKRFEDIELSKYFWDGYLMLGQNNWQEKLTLKDNSNGTTTTLISNAKGYCAGGGMRYGNGYYGYKIDGCIMHATTNVHRSAGNLGEYSQNNVIVSGLVISPGLYYIPKSAKASFGFAGTLFTREGQYSIPSGYSMKEASTTNLGFTIESGLKISEDFLLQANITHSTNINIYTLNLAYFIF